MAKKISITEWARTGSQTFPESDGFNLLTATIDAADTAKLPTFDKTLALTNKPSSVVNKRLYGKESEEKTPLRQGALYAPKFIDLLIQLASGTLMFGFVQVVAERLRTSSNTFASVLSFPLALIGRTGLFVTQTIAAAIRLPFVLISGMIGVIWGIGEKIDEKIRGEKTPTSFLATIADFIWPFAPTAGLFLGLTSAASYFSKQSTALQKMYVPSAIYLVSTAIAIGLVALVATGTLGLGLAAVPFIPSIVVGTTIAVKAIAAVVLVGGLSALFNGLINGVRDNVKAILAPKDEGPIFNEHQNQNSNLYTSSSTPSSASSKTKSNNNSVTGTPVITSNYNSKQSSPSSSATSTPRIGNK